jgi:hypothetical protein
VSDTPPYKVTHPTTGELGAYVEAMRKAEAAKAVLADYKPRPVLQDCSTSTLRATLRSLD